MLNDFPFPEVKTENMKLESTIDEGQKHTTQILEPLRVRHFFPFLDKEELIKREEKYRTGRLESS